MTTARRLAPLLLAFLSLAAPTCAEGPPPPARIRLVDAFPGEKFRRPVFAAQPPDGTARMFVAEQHGVVSVLDHPAPAEPGKGRRRVFLDIEEKVSRWGNEEGLLGFAFHPDYARNGRFFVHYSRTYSRAADRRNVLSVFTADPEDPDRADPASERVLLEVPQPYSNHNGGWIGFGPDGMLFVALGDGGWAGDPHGNGQDPGTLLGSVLRVDPDRAGKGAAYSIPPDNPFTGRSGARGEVWAYGLRNPWRCSFDRETGELWTGDVGQDRWEEVDLLVAGGNYGWNRREGFEPFREGKGTPADPPVDPLWVYGRELGISITGGYVYRGRRLGFLRGAYLCGDYSSGRIWALRRDGKRAAAELLARTREEIASFAEDREGELFVCSFRGAILRIEGP